MFDGNVTQVPAFARLRALPAMPEREDILWARFSALVDILSWEHRCRYEFAEAIEPHEIEELLEEIDAERRWPEPEPPQW